MPEASHEGATVIEYALLAVAIAAVIIAVVFALGGRTCQQFDDTAASISARTSGQSGIACP